MTIATTYKPYCSPCYYHLHPELESARNYLTKQKHLYRVIRDSIGPTTTNAELIYDKQIDNGCSKRRPDFLWDCLTHSVVVENDEGQHAQTQCEDKRLMQIFEDLGNRPLVMIRFNPDNYRDDDGRLVHGAFTQDKTTRKLELNETEWERRWNELHPILLQSLTAIPDREITVIHLFYSKKPIQSTVIQNVDDDEDDGDVDDEDDSDVDDEDDDDIDDDGDVDADDEDDEKD
jgi:hypothetical protein